ncbi:MAG: agmatinase [Gemmatimonadota bacterium]|nr:MAG: agmatinase [Gemmatimonadota bacterium]
MNEFRDKGEPPYVPQGLKGLPWAPPESFLAIPHDEVPFETSPVVVLPVPYESTVSYMGGTRFGPRGLIHASRFLELYDHELDFEPYMIGVHTLPELVLPDSGPEAALAMLQRAMSELLDADKFVIMIGGEHSVSGPAILAHAARYPELALSVLQLDAHCDLRAEYEGTPYSHACVMHRVHGLVNLVPVGIRSLTAEERNLVRDNNIPVVFGHELRSDDWIERVLASLGEKVYVTVDVDYFDPSLVPATGTPEPGGGDWYSTIELLQRVFDEKHVVGCDVVELAPIPGLVAPDFLVAKLVYKMIALYAKRRGH